MLEKLARMLSRPPDKPDPMSRRLAMAVLMVEAARADFHDSAEERAAMRKALIEAFGIDRADAQTLVERAFAHAHEAVSLHEFLQVLNAELDPAGKRELLERLWRVAYADGRLDPQEEARIRQLADLLFIPHADFVRLRLEVEAQVRRHGA